MLSGTGAWSPWILKQEICRKGGILTFQFGMEYGKTYILNPECSQHFMCKILSRFWLLEEQAIVVSPPSPLVFTRYRWIIWCRLPLLKWNIKTWTHISILNTCADTLLQIHIACSLTYFMIWWVPRQINTWTKALYLIWTVFIGIYQQEANMTLWNVITFPCSWYLLLVHRPSYPPLPRTIKETLPH